MPGLAGNPAEPQGHTTVWIDCSPGKRLAQCLLANDAFALTTTGQTWRGSVWSGLAGTNIRLIWVQNLVLPIAAW